jgi:hypothetical protein
LAGGMNRSLTTRSRSTCRDSLTTTTTPGPP